MTYLTMSRDQRRFISRLCLHTMQEMGCAEPWALLTMLRMLRAGKLYLEWSTDEDGDAVWWVRVNPGAA